MARRPSRAARSPTAPAVLALALAALPLAGCIGAAPPVTQIPPLTLTPGDWFEYAYQTEGSTHEKTLRVTVRPLERYLHEDGVVRDTLELSYRFDKARVNVARILVDATDGRTVAHLGCREAPSCPEGIAIDYANPIYGALFGILTLAGRPVENGTLAQAGVAPEPTFTAQRIHDQIVITSNKDPWHKMSGLCNVWAGSITIDATTGLPLRCDNDHASLRFLSQGVEESLRDTKPITFDLGTNHIEPPRPWHEPVKRSDAIKPPLSTVKMAANVSMHEALEAAHGDADVQAWFQEHPAAALAWARLDHDEAARRDEPGTLSTETARTDWEFVFGAGHDSLRVDVQREEHHAGANRGGVPIDGRQAWTVHAADGPTPWEVQPRSPLLLASFDAFHHGVQTRYQDLDADTQAIPATYQQKGREHFDHTDFVLELLVLCEDGSGACNGTDTWVLDGATGALRSIHVLERGTNLVRPESS